MANLAGEDFEDKYNDSSTGLFKSNTTRDITPSRLQTFTTDIRGSFLNRTDDAYTGAKGQRLGATAPSSVKDIVTTSLSFTTLITFVDTTASNVVRIYELVNETTAESLPDVIRPNDYATTTNEKVWRLRATASTANSLSYRGTHSGTSAFPQTNGRWTSGAPAAGDMYLLTAELTVGGNVYSEGTIIMALVNNPGATTLTDWAKFGMQL